MPQDPDILVELTKAATDFDAQVVAAALRDQGVPASVFGRAATTLQGHISPVHAVSISVRRADLVRARTVLDEIRESARGIDWSQVDTADTSALTPEEIAGGPDGFCPACGCDRRGLTSIDICPDCGRSPADASPSPMNTASPRRRRRRAGRLLNITLAALMIALALLAVARLAGS
ncbi:MAG: DUF2007 domain-containing protein [Phycisphaerales bacterium]